MAKDSLTYDDLLRIVELVKSSPQFSEFRLKVGEIELHLKRKRHAADTSPPPPAPSAEAPGGSGEPAKRPPAERTGAWPGHWVVVRSPMVGTFYRAPAPGAAPFVEVGQAVQSDAIVCIIEVMKLMNSIAAGAAGVVREILVEDARAVEYGEPLVVLEPR